MPGTRADRIVGLAAAAGAALLWLLVRGHAGYDLQYALIWGRELGHGHLPALHGAYAPTPHPLANLLGVVVSPLRGRAAVDVSLAVIIGSLGAVGVGAWRVGCAGFGWAAGALAAVIVVSRPVLVSSAFRGSIDVPALGLGLFALDALLRAPVRWERALALLALAGLLRPETWLLSLAVAAWWWVDGGRHAPRARAARIVALAVAAPVLWGAIDLAMTGDPFFSLHGTQALADELGRPRTATLAPIVMPAFLSFLLGLPALLAGIAGLVVLSREPGRPSAVLVAILGLSVVTFVIIGAFGLPLLARYLFPAATVLAILACGVATQAARGMRDWADWAKAAAAVALVVAIPATVTGISDAVGDAHHRRLLDGRLAKLARTPRFRSAVRACGGVSTGTYRIVPGLAYALDVEPSAVSPTPRRGVLVLPRSGPAAASLISPADPDPPLLAPPAGFTLSTSVGTRDWATATSVGCVSP